LHLQTYYKIWHKCQVDVPHNSIEQIYRQFLFKMQDNIKQMWKIHLCLKLYTGYFWRRQVYHFCLGNIFSDNNCLLDIRSYLPVNRLHPVSKVLDEIQSPTWQKWTTRHEKSSQSPCSCFVQPGVNSTNISQAAFLFKSFSWSYSLIIVWLCNFSAKEYWHKSCL